MPEHFHIRTAVKQWHKHRFKYITYLRNQSLLTCRVGLQWNEPYLSVFCRLSFAIFETMTLFCFRLQSCKRITGETHIAKGSENRRDKLKSAVGVFQNTVFCHKTCFEAWHCPIHLSWDTASTSQQVGQPVPLFFSCFIRWPCPTNLWCAR